MKTVIGYVNKSPVVIKHFRKEPEKEIDDKEYEKLVLESK
jgi:hypothetical protein